MRFGSTWWLLLADVAGLFAGLRGIAALRSQSGEAAPAGSLWFYGTLGIVVCCFYMLDLYALQSSVMRLRIRSRMLVSIVLAGGIVFALEWARDDGDVAANLVAHSSALLLACLWASLIRALFLRRQREAWKRTRLLFVGGRGCWERFRADLGESAGLAGVTTEFVEVPDAADFAAGSAGAGDALAARLAESWSGILHAPREGMPDAVADALAAKAEDGARVCSVVEFCEQAWRKVPTYCLQESWLAGPERFNLLRSVAYRRFKTAFDKVAAIVLLVLSAPVIALATLGILLESGRPILYRQTRVGRRGAEFMMYKFRSMRVDAEQDGERWTDRDDDRVTRFGRILRKLRVDEIPQMINVLKGEMSLIGPRPERPGFTAEYVRAIRFYKWRLLAPPGITGWAQIEIPGKILAPEFEEKLEYDLYYVKHSSPLLDLEIVLKTIRIVLFGRGS